MKIAYIDKKFRAKRLELIKTANGIISEYRAQGFDLTLRQLYYQLVARGVIENTERSYKNTGEAIDDARMVGMMDWEAIVDRTRNLRSVSHWSTPADIISSAAYSYRLDKWQQQEYYVEVWVEKEALAGVIERIATTLDLPWFACRGYVSQSEMWAASQRFLRIQSDGRRPVILHLGDHDPSGIDMTRDIIDRMEIFGADIEVKRLALNMDQVEQYNPPPNPAKITDSRAEGYISRFGDESWELDALTPTVLSALIEDAVLDLRDDYEWSVMVAKEKAERADLTKAAKRWDEVATFLNGK
jgi:hypothetical protein